MVDKVQHSAELGQTLHDQRAGHYRTARVVVGQVRVSEADQLGRLHPAAPLNGDDAVEKQVSHRHPRLGDESGQRLTINDPF